MKNKTLFFCLFTVLSSVSAQNNTTSKDSLRKAFYEKHGLQANRYGKFNHFFGLKVEEIEEVDAYAMPFNDDIVGGMFGYCGDLIGGITNLLQTSGHPHYTFYIRFLNTPPKKRYVLFCGYGSNMSSIRADSSGCPENSASVNGRDIILKIMASEFAFEVKRIQDSLDVIEMKVIDSLKLSLFLVPKSQQYVPGIAGIDTKTGKYNLTRAHLSFIAYHIQRYWNMPAYDKTATDKTRYNFTIPGELLNSIDSLPQLNTYLEQNVGLTLVKAKRLEKIHTIEFKYP
jgi:hypothetical protein